MSELKITMAARCEAAGRPNNEDNFQLADNLESNPWAFMTGQEVVLSEKGALMVVCDGMGGMNAGATASGLAVRTIKEWFVSDRLSPQVMASQASIMQYIQQAIIAADCTIKETGKDNIDYKGMGSTIVLAWFVKNYVYIGWCGDSRAYRLNPATGLERLSHDHSYVQELVDRGKLSKDLAFDHPDSYIITRSLGDNRQSVQPDVTCFPLNNGDLIMLCSDGLHGVLRDNEIESTLLNNSDSPENCRNALWEKSAKAGWTDNVTIALCRIVSGVEESLKTATGSIDNITKETYGVTKANRRKPKSFLIFIILLLLGIAFEAGYYFIKGGWWIPTEIIEYLKAKSL